MRTSQRNYDSLLTFSTDFSSSAGSYNYIYIWSIAVTRVPYCLQIRHSQLIILSQFTFQFQSCEQRLIVSAVSKLTSTELLSTKQKLFFLGKFGTL